jgi:hypothetical protein
MCWRLKRGGVEDRGALLIETGIDTKEAIKILKQ